MWLSIKILLNNIQSHVSYPISLSDGSCVYINKKNSDVF